MAEIVVQNKTYTLETQVSVSAPGKSAYQSWLDQGNSGSEADFVNAMLQDATYVHNQQVASLEWVITHNLNKYPAVTVVDSGENVVIGEIQYINSNSVKISFSAEFAGKAYLN